MLNLYFQPITISIKSTMDQSLLETCCELKWVTTADKITDKEPHVEELVNIGKLDEDDGRQGERRDCSCRGLLPRL